MEQEGAFVGKCGRMKESVSEKSADCDREDNAHWQYDIYNQCYWKQYMYIASWARNCHKTFNEWCQLMCGYHATMASYIQSNYISAIPPAPKQLGYDWHCARFPQSMMQPKLPVSSSELHKKCGRGRKRRRRRSRAKRQSLLSSAGDVELHIANIDPDGSGLDVTLGDGNENLEFEFEITEDLVEFFAKTARHRKERGETYVVFFESYFLFNVIVE